jgi:hypothetical protein
MMDVLLEKLFEDKRYTTVLLTTWMSLSVMIFWYLGAFHVQFMTMGPSNGTIFMGLVIDTWNKWWCLASFSFCNTAINEFLGSALMPWFTNTVQDHKCSTLPYSKNTCMVISQMFTIYGHVMSVFGIFLMFSQIDFMLVRMVADIGVNQYSMRRFMIHKDVAETHSLVSTDDTETEVDELLDKIESNSI